MIKAKGMVSGRKGVSQSFTHLTPPQPQLLLFLMRRLWLQRALLDNHCSDLLILLLSLLFLYTQVSPWCDDYATSCPHLPLPNNCSQASALSLSLKVLLIRSLVTTSKYQAKRLLSVLIFLVSLFFSIDLCVCFCASTMLFWLL